MQLIIWTIGSLQRKYTEQKTFPSPLDLCMVYSSTFAVKQTQVNAVQYTSHMDAMGYKDY